MAKVSGLGDNFYIAGVDISGDVNSLSQISCPGAVQDATDITQSATARLELLNDGALDFNVFFDTGPAGTTGEHAVLSQLPYADSMASYYRGTALGSPAASINAKQLNYDWTRATDGSLMGAVSLQANGFGLEWGLQLTPGKRTDTGATAASAANSVDTAASLAFGAQMYVHLFAFTGTSVTIALWDSADNSTFAAMAGMTTTALTAAPAAQRVAISNTSTLRRYLAVATTGTFSNAQFAVMVNKNPVAGVIF